jgi:hypothetical protein
MKKYLAGLAFVVAILGMSGKDVSATLINFDDVTTSGTNINTRYAGVTFGCIDGTLAVDLCNGDNAYAVADSLNFSSPNVISLASTVAGAATDDRYGKFEATFSTAVSYVSIEAHPLLFAEGTGTDTPYLTAYDSLNNTIGTYTYTGSVSSGTWENLFISHSSNDISRIEFSSTSVHSFAVYGVFDNLQFCTADDTSCATGGGNDGGNPGGNPVPEPGTILLMGSGLIGLAIWGRKRIVLN